MTWEEIREQLDKAFDELEALPSDENDRLIAKEWYWHGIANYARIMAEDNDKGFVAIQSGKSA